MDEGGIGPSVVTPGGEGGVGFAAGGGAPVWPGARASWVESDDFEVGEVGVAVFDPGATDEAPGADASEEFVGVATAREGECEGIGHVSHRRVRTG